jgi:hypothetical protein
MTDFEFNIEKRNKNCKKVLPKRIRFFSIENQLLLFNESDETTSEIFFKKSCIVRSQKISCPAGLQPEERDNVMLFAK